MSDMRVVRAAVKARDRKCTAPSCERFTTHVEPIVRDGPVDASNYRGLCRRCRYGLPVLPPARPWLAWGHPISPSGPRNRAGRSSDAPAN